MNVEAFRGTADLIEQGLPGFEFRMSTFGDKASCGTACCIGGWAVLWGQLQEPRKGPPALPPNSYSVAEVWIGPINGSAVRVQAVNVLDLDYLKGEPSFVFSGSWHGRHVHAPAEDAVTYLRACADAGRVLEKMP